VYETIRVEPVASALGARVLGVAAADGVSDTQMDEVRHALAEHLVLFLPAQDLDDDAHRAFTEGFGALSGHPVNEYLGNTEMVGTIGTEVSGFHTDYSFNDELPEVAVLRAVTVPARGGDTMWANMCAVHDALSPGMQEFLLALDAVHDHGQGFDAVIRQRYGGEAADRLMERFGGSTHPLVVVHPATGRRSLFLSPGYTRRIVGLSEGESDAILGYLFGLLAQPRFVCRYHWAPGDVAIWDERVTLHMGEGADPSEAREMRRYIAGRSVPVAARDAGRDAVLSGAR
jgi:taurine dioxygenase